MTHQASLTRSEAHYVEESEKRAVSVCNALNTSSLNSQSQSSAPHFAAEKNRVLIAVIVYFALLLDNMLLTVIVPILPDYLATINKPTIYTSLDISSNLSPAAAQNLAVRNSTGTQTAQTFLKKHPIPGTSMVHFSLLHIIDDKMIATSNPFTPTVGTDQNQNNATKWNAMLNGSTASYNSGNANFSALTRPMAASEKEATTKDLANENGSIGILLAMKAFVQLIFNPIVGNMSTNYGYRLPIVAGTFCLLISSLVFAIGESYMMLLLGRAIQGVGSACIGVCGMSLVAQHYPEEDRRSKIMGIILGSIALGVLLGYPFGGFFYDLVGKSTPFVILATIIFVNLGMQLLTMDLSKQPENTIEVDLQKPKWRPLLESKMILAIVIAILISTSTMAILEPCLPIWLLEHLRPPKWQLGTVFIPDSAGYFVGTNFFASIAYKHGQIKISCMSLLLVGLSSILIPNAMTMTQLLLPHFGLGLGIGIIDAALVPLLATFVDATLMQADQNGTDNQDNTKSATSYGTVYAIQQTSVSLAYCLAPLIGGELAEVLGFAWLIRIIGFLNLIYGPVLVFLYQKYNPKSLHEKELSLLFQGNGRGSQYKYLYESIGLE